MGGLDAVGEARPAMKQSYEHARPAPAPSTLVRQLQVGEGRMTITESRPGELMRIQMEFFKPSQHPHAEFTFKPEGDQTVVTWSMDRDHRGPPAR